MAEKTSNIKKPFSADWLVRGVLTKLGDFFDRLLGRGWKPSSSLATSELIERLKGLVDAEAKETDENRRFVPHNIKLKMQWDKFSIDSEEALKKLEVELLTALVDHINDRRYYTYAPISLEVKPDYFTSGVKLHASFDNLDEEREVSIDAAPDLTSGVPAQEQSLISKPRISFSVRFEISSKVSEKVLELEAGQRLTVGRTKENNLTIDDVSVSKMHAALSLRENGELVIADTGSTNGTFINGERIPYGKATTISAGEELRFGSVNVSLSIVEFKPAEEIRPQESTLPDTEESIKIGDFEFTTRHDEEPSKLNEPEPTLLASAGPGSRILTPLTNDPPATISMNRVETGKQEENDKK